jgi:hypothetical protein
LECQPIFKQIGKSSWLLEVLRDYFGIFIDQRGGKRNMAAQIAISAKKLQIF